MQQVIIIVYKTIKKPREPKIKIPENHEKEQ